MKLMPLGVNGPYPAPGGAGSGYLLQTDDTNLLLDCGPGVLGRLLERISLKELDAVALTHLHYDHMSDMLSMCYALERTGRKKLPVYLPDEPRRVHVLLEEGPMDLHPMADFAWNRLQVRALRAVHPVEAYSLRIESEGRALVYTGDTTLNPPLAEFCRGADLLLADSGMLEREWHAKAPHLSARKCAELAREAGVGRLVLTHIAPGTAVQELLEEARPVFACTEAARPGSCLDI